MAEFPSSSYDRSGLAYHRSCYGNNYGHYPDTWYVLETGN